MVHFRHRGRTVIDLTSFFSTTQQYNPSICVASSLQNYFMQRTRNDTYVRPEANEADGRGFGRPSVKTLERYKTLKG